MVLQLELVEYLKEQRVAVPLADAPNAAHPCFESVWHIPASVGDLAGGVVPAALDIAGVRLPAVVPAFLAEAAPTETSQSPMRKPLLGSPAVGLLARDMNHAPWSEDLAWRRDRAVSRGGA